MCLKADAKPNYCTVEIYIKGVLATYLNISSHIILLFIMLLIILFICLTCFQLNLIQVNKINPEHNYSKACEQHTHNTTYRLLTDEEKMNEEEE